jgi:hypothetical protein
MEGNRSRGVRGVQCIMVDMGITCITAQHKKTIGRSKPREVFSDSYTSHLSHDSFP